MEIKNWRDLKVGQHVRIGCGCEGFITEIHLNGKEEDGSDSGYHMKFTRECNIARSRWGYRNSYSDGYGPYGNYFNYDMPDKYYPIVEIPSPSWWPILEGGPCRKLQKLKAERRRRQIEKERDEKK